MKCIICDSREAVSRGMCTDCIMTKTRITVSGNIELTTCPKCGSWSTGNRWYGKVSNLPLVKPLSALCEVSDSRYTINMDSESIDFIPEESTIKFQVNISDDMGFRSPDIQLEAHASVLKNSCPSCNRLTGSYYESIIQIRSYSRSYSDAVDIAVRSVNDFLSSEKLKGKNAFISKQVRLPEGFDLYLGSKSDGERISKYLHDRFFSEVTQNKKLAGRTEGYDLYRYTFLIRILDIPIGSVLMKRGVKFLLLSVRPDEVSLMDLNLRKLIRLKQNEFNTNPFEYNGENIPVKKYIVISSNGKETEIMDSETFKESTVNGVVTEKEIEGVEIDGEVVLV